MQTRAFLARRVPKSISCCALFVLVSGCCESSNAEAISNVKLFEDGPLILYTTYGQYVELDTTDSDPPELHAGIDIGACPDGKTRVLALEEGYVVKSTFESDQYPADDTRHYVIISRGEDRSHGILYAHLADTPFHEREKVTRGAYIGSVVNWETSGFDHLHIQLVSRYESGLGTPEVWASGEARDDGNPLVELGSCFEDREPPTIEEVSSANGPVAFEFFRPNGDSLPPAGLTGPVVIVARLHDQCGDEAPLECTRSSPPAVVASRVVAPLSFALLVRCTSDTSVAEQLFSLDFKRDVRDKLITDIYHSGTIGTYCERSLRFNLTYAPSNGCAWTPAKTGATYELVLTVEDAAGLKTILPPFAVTVL